MRLAFLLVMVAGAASAGPVVDYREGPQFCPRDRPSSAPVLEVAQAIERAWTMLPREFCAPTRFVAGCEVLPEFVDGSWRIYVHQFQRRNGRNDWGGLTHTYVILDPVGNCLANIPGTEFGAPN